VQGNLQPNQQKALETRHTKSIAYTLMDDGPKAATIKNNVAPFLLSKNIYHFLKKIMKNKSLQLLALSTAFALALSIGVTSCKKDKDDSPKPLTATVNGSGFDPLYATANALQGEILIEATAKDSSYITVSFPDTVKVNTTYKLDDAGLYYYNGKKNAMYTYFTSDAHGTITLSTFDKTNKKVAGKFTGVLYNWDGTKDSVTVTNGQFNTTYK
jgi:hypothetical protein